MKPLMVSQCTEFKDGIPANRYVKLRFEAKQLRRQDIIRITEGVLQLQHYPHLRSLNVTLQIEGIRCLKRGLIEMLVSMLTSLQRQLTVRLRFVSSPALLQAIKAHMGNDFEVHEATALVA